MYVARPKFTETVREIRKRYHRLFLEPTRTAVFLGLLETFPPQQVAEARKRVILKRTLVQNDCFWDCMRQASTQELQAMVRVLRKHSLPYPQKQILFS